MASQSGGAAHLSHSIKSVIFENITCISNQALVGGCLFMDSAILIVRSSALANNHAGVSGTGIAIADSRIQVGS